MHVVNIHVENYTGSQKTFFWTYYFWRIWLHKNVCWLAGNVAVKYLYNGSKYTIIFTDKVNDFQKLENTLHLYLKTIQNDDVNKANKIKRNVQKIIVEVDENEVDIKNDLLNTIPLVHNAFYNDLHIPTEMKSIVPKQYHDHRILIQKLGFPPTVYEWNEIKDRKFLDL
jgi:hypothetical protein